MHGACMVSAAHNGQLEMVKFLMATYGNGPVVSDAITALNEEGKWDVLRYLINEGTDIPTNRYILCAAAIRRYMPGVKLMIEHGTDINAKLSDKPGQVNGPALFHAIDKGHSEIARILLEHVADVNAGGGAALVVAAREGNIEMVQLLLKNKADIRSKGKALRAAAARGQLEVVQILLANGADANACKGDPLMRAARKGHMEVKILMATNADINPGAGGTLKCARKAGHLAIAEFLVQRGANLKFISERFIKILEPNVANFFQGLKQKES
ncbi:ankyrin repeat-containing domain protein [Blyttiomyces helicus]|uniref:Ankyrin repeat-containing domain protein n=1 Tax=Blyttiomyces helicus TaxID=388810 RepID=A0A4P9W767_9FUNG|nr:ankyrin repeat-containing domain protein [Blyttiomyces helicus]|eukprot:RKO87902.1 ankyrin repeat-containing domain protein [Blyttiomyces helicus]